MNTTWIWEDRLRTLWDKRKIKGQRRDSWRSRKSSCRKERWRNKRKFSEKRRRTSKSRKFSRYKESQELKTRNSFRLWRICCKKRWMGTTTCLWKESSERTTTNRRNRTTRRSKDIWAMLRRSWSSTSPRKRKARWTKRKSKRKKKRV